VNGPSPVLSDLDPKHLNPREGITTRASAVVCQLFLYLHPKHLNPREGITTRSCQPAQDRHLPDGSKAPQSPRGDYDAPPDVVPAVRCSREANYPKHLNPREGITTLQAMMYQRCRLQSKAPQSPRGDYDPMTFTIAATAIMR
jgi:hypothetical protein